MSKAESFTIDPERDRMPLFAIAACLNSTLVKPNRDWPFKAMIMMELEDYFQLSEEASQFDREQTFAFLEKMCERQVLEILHAMGKCPFGPDDGDQWQRFVDALADRRYYDLGLFSL